MAGHLSVTGSSSLGWGAGEGAAFVSGGSYHFKFDTLDDNSTGSQDNQIQAGAVKILPAIATTSSPTGSTSPGPLTTDSVTVSGPGGTPTGNVTFFLCGPGLLNAANATTGCPTGGTQIGTNVGLDGSGQATAA